MKAGNDFDVVVVGGGVGGVAAARKLASAGLSVALIDYLSIPAKTVPVMSNAAPWASNAGNKFREITRSTANPTTKLLAEVLRR